jgi:antitoxin component of RelBE/YafQ-DinJ toxin-antitoxin module
MPKTLDNYPPGTTADGKNVCVRLPVELRQQVTALAQNLGVTLSELMRALILKELNEPSLIGVDQGYEAGRRLAIQMVRKIMSAAATNIADMLPETYEEAVARFALAGPGVDPNLVPSGLVDPNEPPSY